MTTPAEKYSIRAAQRLNSLLQEAGAPLDLLGRSAVLAGLLKVEADQARQMLGGRVPWDWDLLHTACTAFGKSPGFFLDEQPGPPLPSDTQVLTSVEGNENIVFRPPTGFLSAEVPLGRWRYGTEREAHLFPDQSLVVFAEATNPGFEVVQGHAYALRTDEGVSFVRCEEIKGARAHFSNGVPGGFRHVLPAVVADQIAGPVLATIQPR